MPYPDELDDFTNPTVGQSRNAPGVEDYVLFSQLNDAVEAIEAELGLTPSGDSATVAERLDSIGEGGGGAWEDFTDDGNTQVRYGDDPKLVENTGFEIDRQHDDGNERIRLWATAGDSEADGTGAEFILYSAHEDGGANSRSAFSMEGHSDGDTGQIAMTAGPAYTGIEVYASPESNFELLWIQADGSQTNAMVTIIAGPIPVMQIGPALISMFDGAGVSQPGREAVETATDPASTMAAVNQMRTALIALGVIVDGD